MIDERIFLGYPIDFKDICQIYPPTVNDVIGNKDFPIYQSLFTMTQEDLNDAYAQDDRIQNIPTPFQYLLMNYYQDEEVKEKIEEAFKFFVHEPVTIVPEIELLLIGKSESELNPDIDLENPRVLTEDNFFDFQNQIRLAIGSNPIKPPEPEDINEDPRVRRWKMKIKEREEILNVKQRKNSQTFGTLLAAGITTMVGIQAVFNIAVVTSSMPVTGISLPFCSYGGTSLIVLLISVGILLSVSRTASKREIVEE